MLAIATDRDGTLRVLMEDPGDFDATNRLATLTGRQIKTVLPIGEGLEELVKRNYARVSELGASVSMAVEAEAAGTAITAIPSDTDDFDGADGSGTSLLTGRNLSQAPVAHAVDMIRSKR